MFVSTCRYAVPGSCASGAICDGVNEGQLQHVPVHPGILEPYHVVKMRLQECVCVCLSVCVCAKILYLLFIYWKESIFSATRHFAYRDMVWKLIGML